MGGILYVVSEYCRSGSASIEVGWSFLTVRASIHTTRAIHPNYSSRQSRRCASSIQTRRPVDPYRARFRPIQLAPSAPTDRRRRSLRLESQQDGARTDTHESPTSTPTSRRRRHTHTVRSHQHRAVGIHLPRAWWGSIRAYSWNPTYSELGGGSIHPLRWVASAHCKSHPRITPSRSPLYPTIVRARISGAQTIFSLKSTPIGSNIRPVWKQHTNPRGRLSTP